MEGQIRCLRLELETRLSLEVTPAMDVWPWMVRHAGWLLKSYHVKANKKTALEDCFGKPNQCEVMKFVEAALFRVAVSPSGEIRNGVRQGRANARFVRGMWLGKTTESNEHLFANEWGVYTTRTVKRVPDSEQKRAELVRSLQGTPWDRLAGRPARRPRKTALQATPFATPPAAKETERPSEDAAERRSAKPQDLNPPTVPHVIRVPRATDTENEPRSSSSRPMETEDGGARDNTACVDAEEIPCEYSVEDDFVIDENTEGVNEEIVKAIVAESFGIFDVCEELPRDAKVFTTRWENIPKGANWRCRFAAREFRHDDPEMEGLYTSGSTAATGRLVDMHAVQHGFSNLWLDAENAHFHAEEDEDVHCWPPKEWMQRYHARGGRHVPLFRFVLVPPIQQVLNRIRLYCVFFGHSEQVQANLPNVSSYVRKLANVSMHVTTGNRGSRTLTIHA